MEKVDFQFPSAEGVTINANKWLPREDTVPKAAVQIAHGMAEHIERYAELAEVLTNAGYLVYGNDHRGHGKTASCAKDIGYLADRDGWKLTVKDMHRLTGMIKKEYPGLPVFLFGHSMGSYLARTYIQDYTKDIKGLILCGTGQNNMLLINAGILIARIEMLTKGKKAKSVRMDKLSFGSFNNAFKPNRTAFDWLNRDNGEVDKYIADSLCGEVFSAGFFYDFLSGLKALRSRERDMGDIPKDLPVLFISGEDDPVGDMTKGVVKAIAVYKNARFKDIVHKFYPQARHEILHETNQAEVFRDIIAWLDKHCQ